MEYGHKEVKDGQVMITHNEYGCNVEWESGSEMMPRRLFIEKGGEGSSEVG